MVWPVFLRLCSLDFQPRLSRWLDANVGVAYGHHRSMQASSRRCSQRGRRQKKPLIPCVKTVRPAKLRHG